MKKGLIIFGVCVLGFAWIMSTMIDFADKSIEKQREKLGDYAELLKEDLKNPPEEGAVSPQEKDETVKCENEYYTGDNILILHNCTVDNIETKLCYYENEVYDCKDKKYKELYNKLDLDSLEEIK